MVEKFLNLFAIYAKEIEKFSKGSRCENVAKAVHLFV